MGEKQGDGYEVFREDIPFAYDHDFIEFTTLLVIAWSPEAVPGKGPPTELHVVMDNSASSKKPIYRMDSRKQVDDFIEVMKEIRDRVWPEEGGAEHGTDSDG